MLRLRPLIPCLLAGLLGFASTSVAQDVKPTEKPWLWIVEGEKPSFLYGTIHVPDDRVLALPEVVEEAIGLSDGLLCELKMDPQSQMQQQMAMMGKAMMICAKAPKLSV